MEYKKYFSEVVGTFALVFCGTGAIIINQETGGTVTNLGIALTFGLIVGAMIFSLGEISGAHMNPVVTLSFAITKQLPAKNIVPYIFSQTIGAFAASAVLKMLFSENQYLGATIPRGSEMQSFVLEIILTMILVLVIFNVSTHSKEKVMPAAIAIGSVVGLEAMFAGPICGASMNPMRSLSPAIVSTHTEHLWVYLTAPVIGALLGVLIHKLLYTKQP